MKKLICILAMAIISMSSAMAQTKVVVNDSKGWHKIGETTVDFKKDIDEVKVVGADRFASLMFKVTDAPINLVELEVFYESGDNQKIKVGYPIKAPGQSKAIDVNGVERSIKKIVFIYKTLPNHKDEKAHVEIWGLKTNAEK